MIYVIRWVDRKGRRGNSYLIAANEQDALRQWREYHSGYSWIFCEPMQAEAA